MSAAELPWQGRRLHFVGVGGAGMSAYARAASALGAAVSGSDVVTTPYLTRLAEDGILEATLGHAPGNLPPGDGVELVYSSAVGPDNAEREAARERGLPERPRAELLAELTALRRTIAVAGTHGKTTTASMLVHAMRGAGLSPGWLIGASPGGDLPNAHWSSGEWLVVEADESDRSMLSLSVAIALLTNVELDHHTTFASLAQLREAFRAFLSLAREAIVIWDRPELLALSGEQPLGALVKFEAPSARLGPDGSRFQWRGHDVQLAVLGAHNALERGRGAGGGSPDRRRPRQRDRARSRASPARVAACSSSGARRAERSCTTTTRTIRARSRRRWRRRARWTATGW